MVTSSTAFVREARDNLRLALPIVVAQLTFMGMGVVDTLMAGRLGASTLAAVAVGHSIWMPVFIFFLGLMMAVSPIVAHRVGAGRPPPEIGGFLRQALVLAVGVGVAWTLLVRNIAGPVIGLLGLAPATAVMAEDYLLAESWAGVAFSVGFVLRYGMEGVGHSRPIVVAGLCGFVVNAIMDYALMYGAWGFPALGAEGCGWATTIAAVVITVVYLLQYRVLRPLRSLVLFRRAATRVRQWPEIPWLGVPIGLILLAEAGLFAASGLFMARFGDVAVASHQVAMNFAALAFMVPMGLGFATTVRVGQAAGAGQVVLLRQRGSVGMGLALTFGLFSAALMGLRPEWITAAYTNDAAVAAQAQTFLRLAALFQLFDCLQASANGALRGLKDVRVPMAITITAYWVIGMPVGYTLAFGTEVGPPGLWWGLIAGLGAAAAGLAWRFARATRAGAAGRSVKP